MIGFFVALIIIYKFVESAFGEDIASYVPIAGFILIFVIKSGFFSSIKSSSKQVVAKVSTITKAKSATQQAYNNDLIEDNSPIIYPKNRSSNPVIK
jgi:hypothetical protein